MPKTLYFEGAGCVPRGEVENCRIRTAFHHYNGRGIYVEIIGNDVPKGKRSVMPYWAVNIKEYAGIVTDCFFTDDHKYFNTHTVFEYTKKNILDFVNSLGGDFEEVVILPDLAGYPADLTVIHPGGAIRSSGRKAAIATGPALFKPFCQDGGQLAGRGRQREGVLLTGAGIQLFADRRALTGVNVLQADALNGERMAVSFRQGRVPALQVGKKTLGHVQEAGDFDLRSDAKRGFQALNDGFKFSSIHSRTIRGYFMCGTFIGCL